MMSKGSLVSLVADDDASADELGHIPKLYIHNIRHGP
jgi:hypothetical protein